MIKHIATLLVVFLSTSSFAHEIIGLGVLREKLIYHEVKLDSEGSLLPWYDADPGRSYDHVLDLVFNFWDTMRVDINGLPYYMNHQVWRADFNDSRGVGGDQFAMALSSWQLYYAYTGNERVKQNMKFMTDYYLTHSLSTPDAKWPNIPYPYNTLIYSGQYDGDMVIGAGFTQPDKAGSFALELIHEYKMTARDLVFPSTANRYYDAALKIAHTLMAHIWAGDNESSPLPFKVNAMTGEIGQLNVDNNAPVWATYTSNWAPTMELFLELKTLDPKNAAEYQKSFDILLTWMKTYPLKTNRWGPFFEDVQGWSDTQINAITFAKFMMDYPQYFPNWKSEVPPIFAWVYKTLGNENWKNYGVTIINEQTSYQTPGQSHVARQGAVELQYCAMTGNCGAGAAGADIGRYDHAVRLLNWATYAVDNDGKNMFPSDEIWLTDGYGDYVKHYLHAMAAYPRLAPGSSDHIISSTSVIQKANYKLQGKKLLVPHAPPEAVDHTRVYYRTFDLTGSEVIRLAQKPAKVLVGGQPLTETDDLSLPGYNWSREKEGGVLRVNRATGSEVFILE